MIFGAVLCCSGGYWRGCEPLTAPLQPDQQLCLPFPPPPDTSSTVSSALTKGRKSWAFKQFLLPASTTWDLAPVFSFGL